MKEIIISLFDWVLCTHCLANNNNCLMMQKELKSTWNLISILKLFQSHFKATMTKTKHEVMFHCWLILCGTCVHACVCFLWIQTSVYVHVHFVWMRVISFFPIGITEYVCHTEMLMKGRFMLVDLDEKMKPKLENLCYTLANFSLKYL